MRMPDNPGRHRSQQHLLQGLVVGRYDDQVGLGFAGLIDNLLGRIAFGHHRGGFDPVPALRESHSRKSHAPHDSGSMTG